MSYCQITLVGRLGRNPEVRVTQTGKEIVTASMAIGKDDKTQWFTLVCWEKTGMWLKDAAKGDMVFVQGSLEIKTYEKKSGGTAIDATVNAQVVRAMTAKKEINQDYSGQQPRQATQQADFSLDDCPF
jgi:single-strand DNA-binding protein